MSVPEKTAIAPATYGEALLGASPRYYMRINVTKNTKGYSYETTVSVESDSPETTGANAMEMLRDADGIARSEIWRRTEDDGREA